jgi:hypothetical protein
VRWFDRSVEVVIFSRRATPAPGEYFEQAGDAIRLGPDTLRVQFEVKKNLAKEPNTASIHITNLSARARQAVENGPTGVQLFAGYASEPRLLFAGDVSRAWTERENTTDLVTQLHVADGLRAYANARLDKSYKSGATIRRVLEDAAGSMGLALPPELKDLALMQRPVGGLASYGPSRYILTTLLARYGYHWSIQNEQLQILRDDLARSTEKHIVDAATGLLASPKRKMEAKKDRKAAEITFQTLLRPELAPGEMADVTGETERATVKIIDVKHTGDTRGDDFTTECIGRPL